MSSSELTHERCSELLLAYSHDELAEADAAKVTGHLEACAECRAELAGLKALLAPQVDDLTEAERVRLHGGIQAALGSREDAPAPVLSMDVRRRQRWGQRAVQALGVAAALAVIAVGVSYLFSGESLQNDQAVEGAGGGDAAQDSSSLPGPRPRFAHLAAAAPEAFVEGGDRTTAQKLVRRLALADLDLSRGSYVRNLGRNPLLSRFANSYTAADAEELGPAFIDALASSAGDARAEVAECAETVPDGNPGPTVPVFGSFTRFQDKDALVIAFIFADEGGDRLDRYTIWVWRRGSCDTPVHTAFGIVR